MREMSDILLIMQAVSMGVSLTLFLDGRRKRRPDRYRIYRGCESLYQGWFLIRSNTAARGCPHRQHERRGREERRADRSEAIPRPATRHLYRAGRRQGIQASFELIIDNY